jgi:hypothetical protein
MSRIPCPHCATGEPFCPICRGTGRLDAREVSPGQALACLVITSLALGVLLGFVMVNW